MSKISKDVSIAFKASDNLSNSIKQMQQNVKGISRDVSEYRKIQSQAFDKKTEIKLDITKAKQELKELEKAVKQNVEGSEKAFKEKQKSIELLNEEYRRLTQVAKEAGKAEKQLQEDISRTSNKNASRNTPSIMSSLATAGLGNMLGNAASNGLNQMISSIYGQNVGSAIGNVAGGIASGAAIGSIIPGIGTAVGAAVGGLTGAINALAEKQQREDDFFKEEVKSIYAKVKQEQEQGLARGTEFTSLREQNIKALGTLLGSKESGAKMFDDIRQFGIDTPYEATSMLNSAKQMLAYGIAEENIMSDMKMIGEVAMGDQNKFNSLSYVYAQTQSAGKLNGQDLRQYTEAGFNPLKVLAEESGKSLEVMREQMSEGLISAADVTRAFQIATQEGGQFYGAMADQMNTYAGKLAMLDDIKAEIEGGYGEGYTEERKKGMDLEIEQLNGEIGEKMKQANSLIGEFKADLENQYQQAIIKATEEAMKSEEYLKAEQEGNGAEMGRIIAEARAKAEAEYKNSEAYKIQQEADLQLVTSIQNDVAINRAYLDYGEKMANQFSKGWKSVLGVGNTYTEATETNLEASKETSNWWFNPEYLKYLGNGNATGLPRVPQDGVYYLHEGEEVVNRVDADKSNGGNVTIAKLADSIIIREEADIEKFAKLFAMELIKANEVYVGG